ncbi:unnamed protein product [Haemonchus placei]|uniref:TIL domain-containing protein n=1 Tax=Haemonchus placei TaxID=6290 RepID=A0A0N4X4R9_HAEPC|nr:unnamed protein product [Haemonchus placei]
MSRPSFIQRCFQLIFGTNHCIITTECICKVLSKFSDVVISDGVLHDSLIPIVCPKNAEYRECTNICPAKTCSNFDKVSSCFSLRCGPPACMCKEGHVQLSKDIEQGCVPRETCLMLSNHANNCSSSRNCKEERRCPTQLDHALYPFCSGSQPTFYGRFLN